MEDINNISRSNLVDKLISLKSIENDLSIRICKFDDDTKGVHSFNKAINEVSDQHPNKKELIKKIAEFSQLIKDVKKEDIQNWRI